MSLPRIEFELLSFLERNKSNSYTVRELSDHLCVSMTIVIETLKKLQSEGKLVEFHNYFELTDKGLTALEPYRVKRAVILAAGFGSRMLPATADRPKPLVTVNGIRIIDSLLDALVSVGIEDITIVRGYRKEAFAVLLDKYPFVKLVDNDQYDTTNNISSIMEVLGLFDGGCYLCEADLLVSNPEIITKYQYTSNILGSWSLQTDDWSFRMKEGYITDYQKGNTYCWNDYGISYWTPEDCIKLQKDFKDVWEGPDGKDYFWEFIPLILKKENYAVEIRQCRKQDIVEIDNYYELAQLDPSYKMEQ